MNVWHPYPIGCQELGCQYLWGQTLKNHVHAYYSARYCAILLLTAELNTFI